MTTDSNASGSGWPAWAYAQWAPTKRSLHLIAQMLGKIRLALAPPQPNFLFTALYLTPRGFTTGPIPVGLRILEVQLDLFDPSIILTSNDGARRALAITQLPTIAALYRAVLAELASLNIDVTLSPVPQEVPDQTPLDRDERPLSWVAGDARQWLQIMSASQAVFDRWRAHFFGRTAIALWWGAFDLALLLFSGKHVDPPTNRGYLFKYDLDAEMMNAGLYPGDDSTEAFYYGYIYPEPAGCPQIDLGAPGATWSDRLHEWILPYETVRRAPQPEQLLRAFLDGIYNACCQEGAWDRALYRYAPPPLRHGKAP